MSLISHDFQAETQLLRLTKEDQRFALDLATKGQQIRENNHFKWDLKFSGLCYDDGWMLDLTAADRDY